jgi:CHAD domain-containing protein
MEKAPLRLSLVSKASRGYEIAQGRDASGPIYSQEINLTRDATTKEAFQLIANACLHQIADNYEAVIEENAEGVHQMRVGLRRLRAAMSLFKMVVRDEGTTKIKNELKWLMDELGPARQFHVFCKDVVKVVHRAHRQSDGINSFIDDLDRRYDEAKTRATRAVSSDRFRRLLLDTAEWIRLGSWTKSNKFVKSDAKKFAKHVLQARTRKIVQQGKGLYHLNAGERHKLRIAAKKLRYGSEFFDGLFAGQPAKKRKRRFISALKNMQDCLGELNDVTAHNEVCTTIADDAPHKRDPAHIGFYAGVALGREEVRAGRLLRASSPRMSL